MKKYKYKATIVYTDMSIKEQEFLAFTYAEAWKHILDFLHNNLNYVSGISINCLDK